MTTTNLDPIRDIEGIEEYLLENGLKVLLLEDPTQPTVTVNLVYSVGSRHEGRGEAGMAHLLEHMLFKGTPTNPNIKGVLQDKGCIFNATTWLDRTNYYETLPASESNLRFCLELEADRMINSFIAQKDLDAEMTVVRNEFEMGENDPFHVLHDQMMSAAYRWHNYGKSTIGNRSDIERVPAETLKKFYKKYYQPDNAQLIIAGQFDKMTALGLVGEIFGPIPKPSRELEQTYTEEPPQDGPRVVNLQRAGDVAFVGTAYHIPSAQHKDYATIKVLSELLGGEPSGKLYKSLVESNMAAEVYAMAYALAEPAMMLFFSKPKENSNAEQVLTSLINEVEFLDFKKETTSFTQRDLDRAKNHILKNIKLSMTNSKDFALRLSESIAQGDFALFFMHRDWIKNVSLEDIKRVCETYFIESNRTTGVFTPTAEPKRAHIPASGNFTQNLKAYNKLAESKNQTNKNNLKFEASAQNIKSLINLQKINSNINLANLEKPTRLDAVKLRLIFRVGDKKSLINQNTNLKLLADMLPRGTKNKTYEEIQEELDRLQSSMVVFAATGAIVANLTSDKGNISELIDLLSDLIKNPEFSQKEFKILVNKELSELEENISDPQTLALNAIARAKNPWPIDSIHYVQTLDEQMEDLKQASLGNIKKLYADLFGAQHLDISCVGAFEDKIILEKIESHFSDFKTNQPYYRIEMEHREVSDVQKVIQTADKEMAFISMATNFKLTDNDPEYPALRLASYIFGESMKSRMMMRIREKEGLAYGCGSYLDVESLEKSGNITLYSMCSPTSAQKTLDIMKEELNLFISEGITKKELDEAFLSYQSHFDNMLANDGFLVKMLSSDLEIERDLDYYINLLENMKSLTHSEINLVIKNLFEKSKWAEVMAGDFEKQNS